MMRKLVTTLSSHPGLTGTLLERKKVKLSEYELRLATDLIKLLSPVEEATELLQKRQETASFYFSRYEISKLASRKPSTKAHVLAKRQLKSYNIASKSDSQARGLTGFLMGAFLDPRFKCSWCSSATAEQMLCWVEDLFC
ncbi:hypothetical protein MRX96_036398 [Rhipicephalus microplus]